MNVASYDNYMPVNSFLAFAFFYDNLIAIRCVNAHYNFQTTSRGILNV